MLDLFGFNPPCEVYPMRSRATNHYYYSDEEITRKRHFSEFNTSDEGVIQCIERYQPKR